MRHTVVVAACMAAVLLVPRVLLAGWVRILEDNFSFPLSWTYEGATNALGQPLFRPNAGAMEAEWDQTNHASYLGDPYVIIPFRLLRPLPRALTDSDTFRVGATLWIVPGSVPDTTEFYQIANLGLYNPDEMGPDRAMDDNWSGNTNLLRDGSDFVEFNYWINNKSWGFNPSVQAVIGAHIEGLDGDYWPGSSADAMWHSTDMGADHWLPEGTSLYVEVTYFGAASGPMARRAMAAVYTDPMRTNLLTVNGVEMYYWSLPLPTDRTFRVTHVGFYNYVAANWGGPNGGGRGIWDDLYVDQVEADVLAWSFDVGAALTFAAVSGEVYRIETCTDPMTGIWSPLTTVTAEIGRVTWALSNAVPPMQWIRVTK